MSEFRFAVNFEKPVANLVLPEDITIAKFAIYADGDCLTRNKSAPRSRLLSASDTVFGPVAGLADWLIENWDPLLWETQTPFEKTGGGETSREASAILGASGVASNLIDELETDWIVLLQNLLETAGNLGAIGDLLDEKAVQVADWHHRHTLGHANSNLAIPTVVLIPEEHHMIIAVDRLPTSFNSSVKFLGKDDQPRSPGTIVVSKKIFEEQAKDFINKTIERAQTSKKFAYWANWLSVRWEEAQKKEAQPENRLNWMLGGISAKKVMELRQSHPEIASGIQELLLDCPIVTQKSQLTPIHGIVSKSIGKEVSSKASNEKMGWESLLMRSIPANLPAYSQGYELAKQARSSMVIGEEPIRDMKQFLKQWDVKLDERADTRLFRAATCGVTGKQAHIIPSGQDPRMTSPAGYRFGVASALGRLMWQSTAHKQRQICAAQGDYAMLTQSPRANAFAAELLLPADVLKGVGPDRDRVWRLSEDYGISFAAASWHARNVRA